MANVAEYLITDKPEAYSVHLSKEERISIQWEYCVWFVDAGMQFSQAVKTKIVILIILTEYQSSLHEVPVYLNGVPKVCRNLFIQLWFHAYVKFPIVILSYYNTIKEH